MQRPFDLPPYVGAHPDAVSVGMTPEKKVLCPYCADGRAAHKLKGGWWHVVARGGDLGQYEPCSAGKSQNAQL